MQALVMDYTGHALNETAIQVYLDQTLQILSTMTEVPLKPELSLVFVSASRMQELNHQYRQKNYPTDILSFAGDSMESFGDLIFCYEKLQAQAAENQHSMSAEFLYLLIHGILHLLGYDHESQQDAVEMFKIQDRAFDLLRDSSLSSFDCFKA